MLVFLKGALKQVYYNNLLQTLWKAMITVDFTNIPFFIVFLFVSICHLKTNAFVWMEGATRPITFGYHIAKYLVLHLIPSMYASLSNYDHGRSHAKDWHCTYHT